MASGEEPLEKIRLGALKVLGYLEIFFWVAQDAIVRHFVCSSRNLNPSRPFGKGFLTIPSSDRQLASC
jgi:hypothetical protein